MHESHMFMSTALAVGVWEVNRPGVVKCHVLFEFNFKLNYSMVEFQITGFGGNLLTTKYIICVLMHKPKETLVGAPKTKAKPNGATHVLLLKYSDSLYMYGLMKVFNDTAAG